MIFRAKLLCVAAISGLAAFAASLPAQALTMQECSAKYKQAKDANTLNGQKWNDFRKAQCGADATATPAAAPGAPAAEAKPVETKPAAKEAKEAAPAAAPAAPVDTGNAVFPSAVDAKFASEKPHMARMHTCAEQWKANKTANTTGGMHWNQKGGGGFYSECNKRLKGST
jgi:hypothetical protein